LRINPASVFVEYSLQSSFSLPVASSGFVFFILRDSKKFFFGGKPFLHLIYLLKPEKVLVEYCEQSCDSAKEILLIDKVADIKNII
jgi:hypothetical protein